jgi:hypothetical protein
MWQGERSEGEWGWCPARSSKPSSGLLQAAGVFDSHGLPPDFCPGRYWSHNYFYMEPNLRTPPELSAVLDELSSREPIFHRPEFGTTRADFEKMTVDDFWEVGASGRRYSRTHVLDELDKRFAGPHADDWECSDFHCRQIAADVFLLTYTLLQNRERQTRRATLWQRGAEGWKIIYHQGTIVEDLS